MAKSPAKLLRFLVFLVALFITYSAYGVNVCVPRPQDALSEESILLELDKVYHPYHCGAYCCFDVNISSGSGYLKYTTSKSLVTGLTETRTLEIASVELNGVSCTRIIVAEDGNFLGIVSCSGNGLVALEENVEKGVEYSIFGGIVVDPDPVFRWYIRVEGNVVKTLYRLVTDKFPSASFGAYLATCNLRVVNFNLEKTAKGTAYVVFGSFQILDGTRPVQLSDVQVEVDGKKVIPSFLTDERKYQFWVELSPGNHVIRIVGDVGGCGKVVYTKHLSLSSPFPWSALLFVALLLLFVLWKHRSKP